MESLSLEEEKIIKDIRNLFTQQKELNYFAIKDIRSLFRLKKTKPIKDRIFKDIKNLFEHEEEADEAIKELFDLIKNRFQNNLELMKASEFLFNYVHLLYYKCHKININRSGSYNDYADWIKSKKATINPINKKR